MSAETIISSQLNYRRQSVRITRWRKKEGVENDFTTDPTTVNHKSLIDPGQAQLKKCFKKLKREETKPFVGIIVFDILIVDWRVLIIVGDKRMTHLEVRRQVISTSQFGPFTLTKNLKTAESSNGRDWQKDFNWKRLTCTVWINCG